MGEGETIGAPAAVVAALNGAMRDYDADIDSIPVGPGDIRSVLASGPRLQEEKR